MAAGNILETLVLRMKSEVAEGVAGIQSINAKLGKMGEIAGKTATAFKGLAAAAAGAAFTGLSKSLMDAGAESKRFADQIGSSVEELGALSRVASSAGVSTHEFRMSIRQLLKNTENAKDGLKEFGRAFEKLEISPRKLQKLDLSTQFAVLARGFENLESDAQRNQVAMKLFGESNDVMVRALKLGAAAWKDAQETYKDELLTGKESDKFIQLQDKIQELSTRLGTIGQKLLAPFVGPLLDITKSFELFVDIMHPILAIIGETIAGVFGFVLKTLIGIGAAIMDVLDNLGIDFQGFGGILIDFSKWVGKAFEFLTRTALNTMFFISTVVGNIIDSIKSFGEWVYVLFTEGWSEAAKISAQDWENWGNTVENTFRKTDELMGAFGKNVKKNVALPDVSPEPFLDPRLDEGIGKYMKSLKQAEEEGEKFLQGLIRQTMAIGLEGEELDLLNLSFEKFTRVLIESTDPKHHRMLREMGQAIADFHNRTAQHTHENFIKGLQKEYKKLRGGLTVLEEIRMANEDWAKTVDKVRQKNEQRANEMEEQAVNMVKTIQLQEQHNEELRMMQDIGREIGSIFGSAFEEALISGQRFQDFLEDLANDLIRFGTRELITKPLEEGFGQFFGGLSGKSKSTATTGTGTLANLGHFFGNLFNFFAEGGFPKIGQPAIVGEQGPEVFLPTTSGVIIPGNRMDSLGNTTINMHITTPDADSFRQSQSQIMADLNRVGKSAHRRFK